MDLAIVNARIRTLDPARPFASSITIKDGIITDLDGDVSATQVIDAHGMALVPGLTDSHIHPFWGAEIARGTDLTACTTVDEVLEALAATEVHRGWMFAWGLDYDAAPTPEQIARAVPGVAAFVRLTDLHTALVTPRALELAQVTGAREFPDHSEVVVDEDGAPTGELREFSAIDLVLKAAPGLRWPEMRARHVAQLKRLNALGLTGAHVMDGEPQTFDLLKDLEGTGELTLRMRIPLWQSPHVTDEEMEAQLRLRDERGKLWRGGVAKFFADGVIDTGTAWLEAPDTHGESLESFWPEPERLAQAIATFANAGFQCATHTIGDAAARFVLGVYKQVEGHRHRLEHLETLPDDLVREIAQAGVTASMQPLHLAMVRGDGSGNWNERLGPGRAGRAFRWKDLLDAGAPLAFGSDWPVADADPRLGLAAAQLRRLPTAELPVMPEQGLTAEQALAAYTTGAAYAVGDEREVGRIREGMRADLTGLAADPVDTPAEELPDVPIWLTVVDGRIVYADDSSSASRDSTRLISWDMPPA